MKKILMAIMASAALLWACDEFENQASLDIPKESKELFDSGISFPSTSEGGALSATLKFTAGAPWSATVQDATKAPDWLSVEPSSGPAGEATVTITALSNDTEEPRVATVTFSCGDIAKTINVTQAGQQPTPAVTIELDKTSAELTVGETLQLTATVTTTLPAAPNVVWSSSDTDVATVTTGEEIALDGTYLPAGLVTAVGEGEAVITASAEGQEAQCVIKVGKKAETDGLIINPPKVTILKNEKLQLSVTDAAGNAVKASWSTTDNMVAVVDENNILEARNPGSAIVTATADGKTGTCEVTVTDEIAVESIAFDLDEIEMNVGEKRQLNVIFTPENATNKTIYRWFVDGGNPTVTVDEGGVVTAVMKGTAIVGAAIDPERIARCTIKVNDPDNPDITVESITLDQTTATVYTRQSEPLILTATVTPAEVLKSKSIEWKSTNPTNVLVERINDTQAKVVGLVSGRETITANIGGKSASCEVTVSDGSGGGGSSTLERVSVDPASVTLNLDEEKTLNLVLVPADAEVTIYWESSAASIAKVSMTSKTQAKVKGMSVGTATLTAHAGNLTATCAVTVQSSGATVPVESVTLNVHELQLSVGEQFQLVPTVLPETATEKGVVYSSNVSGSKLYIDTNGMLTGLQACEATVTVRCKDNAYIYDTCKVTVTEGSSTSGDEEVDLGLPSGLKWRSMNVGASKPEDYGDYFAWAETSPKSKYSSSNYKYPATSYSDGITIYKRYDTTPGGDGKTVLLAEDDAATVNLGNGWRTPKSKEFKELRENCTWTWTTQGGVSGMRVTGPNGKSIFLPAGGWYENSTLNSKGSYGSYWTASGDGGTASAVDFINNDKSAALVPRSEGRSVRPVKD